MWYKDLPSDETIPLIAPYTILAGISFVLSKYFSFNLSQTVQNKLKSKIPLLAGTLLSILNLGITINI